MESRMRERDRLTRDIHDTIGYTLTNTVMMAEAIKVMVRTEPDRIPEHIRRIRAHTEEGLASIRKILRDFRAREPEKESVYWTVKKLVGEVLLYLASSTSNRADDPVSKVLERLDAAEKKAALYFQFGISGTP